MRIEDKIFNTFSYIESKLIEYGFILDKDTYRYSTNILNNSFNMIISITKDNKVSIKLIDNDFKEEYDNYRNDSISGEYVSRVRSIIEDTLIDIRKKCFTKEYFYSKQANRITEEVIRKYNINPEYPWNDVNGTFKNEKGKWFALIMFININKISKYDKYTNVMNIKLDTKLIEELVLKDGYYPAYHMNKKYWISIVLDDTLSDEEILKYLDMSYNLVK